MRSEKWDVGSVKLGQALRSLALKSTPHTSHLSHHNNKLQFIKIIGGKTMEDIEIARKAKLKNINEVAKELGIEEEYIEQYGKYKAKISNKLYEERKNKKDGKLILVTSINPTPLGEGKTTISIGLADGLSCIGKKSILALREPSLRTSFWNKRWSNRRRICASCTYGRY